MSNFEMRLTGALVLLFMVLFAIITPIQFATIEQLDIVVTGKERITTGAGESLKSKYLVFTDGEVFENTDTFLYGKFNSSDIQGRLRDGQKFRVTVWGWRVPVLSMYRNILSVESAA